MNWNEVPSLISLRAFYGVSRLGSFSAAAAELNVTHTAISQHVRSLESFMGTALVKRDARGVSLTERGTLLASYLDTGFSQIIEGVRCICARDTGLPIRISTTPLFAENWLLPRLGKFWQDHPSIQVMVLPSTDTVDLLRDDIDVAIRFGSGSWPGLESKLLVEAGFHIIGSPDYFQNDPNPDKAALMDANWLLETGRPESQAWLRSIGIIPKPNRIREFPTSSMVLNATRQGLGLSAYPASLLENDLSNGTLRSLLRQDRSDLAYHLITSPRLPNPNLKAFLSWIKCCG